MDPTQNTGSFMAPSGGGGPEVALQMARQSRGLGTGVLNQVGPGAPTFPDAAQTPQPVPGQAPPGPQMAPAQPGAPAQEPESKMILDALIERLQHGSKIEKFQVGM